MNMLRTFFADQGKNEDNIDMEQPTNTAQPRISYSTPKFDSKFEQSTASLASSIISPNHGQGFAHAIWPTRSNKRSLTSKVTPLIIDKTNNQTSIGFGKSLPETTPPQNGKKKNLSKDKLIPKTAETFNRKTNRPIRRASTAKIAAFNPKDYEEPFDMDDILRRTCPKARKRGLSAIGVLKNSLDESSEVSVIEDSENFEDPTEDSHKFQSNRGDPQSANGEVIKSPEEWKISSRKNSPEKLQSKSPNQVKTPIKSGTPVKSGDKSGDKRKGSPEREREEQNFFENQDENQDEHQDENLGFYEDVDFANRSDDEFSPLVRPKKKEFARQKPASRLRDDPLYRDTKWIIYPDDPFKIWWDLIIILLLLYTAIVLPLRIAYIDDSAPVWEALDWVLNGFFTVDIFVNFMSAYFDANMTLIVNKKKIAKNYILGWLIFDILAIIPFDVIIGASNSYQQLIRVARLSRLYKMLKMIKLVRMVKLVRERIMIMNYIHQVFHMKPQIERLVVSFLVILLFVHISACVWKFLLDYNIDQPNNWLKVYHFYDQDGNLISTEWDIYVASFYMIVQTVVTVGYGDLSGATMDERIACIFWMFVGVFLYSFTIGSLASLISTVDAKQAEFNKRLNVLLQLKRDYKFSNRLYLKIKHALRYGVKQAQDNIEFLQELPTNLGQDLSCIIYKEIIDSIPFFKNKPKSFISAIAPLLRPMKVAKGDYIFLEGDPADEIFFLKSGQVAYVIPKYYNFRFLKIKKGYYFGEIDLLFYGEVRKYTVQASRTCELLVLNKKDFKQMFFMDFRDIGMEFADLAFSRKIRTKRTYKEALNYLTKGGAKTDQSAALQHQMTTYEDRLLKPEEDDDDENESPERGVLNHNIQALKTLSGDKEDQAYLEKKKKTEEIEAKLSSKAARNMQMSKFFETTRLPIFGNATSKGEISPISQRLNKSMSIADVLPTKLGSIVDHLSDVREIENIVLWINDRINSLLELTTRLKPYNVLLQPEVVSPLKRLSKKYESEAMLKSYDQILELPLERKSASFQHNEFLKIASNRSSTSKKAQSCVLDTSNVFSVNDASRNDIQHFDHKDDIRVENLSLESEEEETLPMLKDVLLRKSNPKLLVEKQDSKAIN